MFATVGVLHPGNMGAALCASVAATGREVLWASAGRTSATRARAEAAGAIDAGTVSSLVRAADLVISICPPSRAEEVAGEVASLGFGGTYVDANAVSRETASRIGETLRVGGASFVDGSVIGPSRFESRRTRLYLSGDGAANVAEVVAADEPLAVVLDGPIGMASALKMCYGAWTKSTSALFIAIRALAVYEGVEELLLEQWASGQEKLDARSVWALQKASTHGWRWIGEMEEVAESFRAAGVPDGFPAAAAAVFAAFPRRPDEVLTPSEEILRRLREGRPDGDGPPRNQE
jgi:3-hydroxyisobutyrate dehydrogenase-like beta-hydroxyacid dehydrogenase